MEIFNSLTTHTSLSPIQPGFTPGFVNYKKRCIRLAATSDKVYQLLAHGLWFSPGTPASSTTKTGHHDIAEILLKVALNTISQIKSNQSIGLTITSGYIHDYINSYNSFCYSHNDYFHSVLKLEDNNYIYLSKS
jgi:hypothetical protein